WPRSPNRTIRGWRPSSASTTGWRHGCVRSGRRWCRVATTNDRIFAKLEEVGEGVAEVKLLQRVANGRTSKLEERMDTQEQKERARGERDAFAKGLAAGAGGMCRSKKQVGAAVGALGVLLAGLDALVRVLT